MQQLDTEKHLRMPIETINRDRAAVAFLVWDKADGIAEVVCHELEQLNYKPLILRPDESIPAEAAFVFTYGPYGHLLEFLSQLNTAAPTCRPISIHWNTEGIPDPRIPWFLVKALGIQRSLADHFLNSLRNTLQNHLVLSSILGILSTRMLRFRYVGDLYRAYRQGWVDVIGDTSLIFARLRSDHGLPTLFVPWGVTPKWYAALNLERDIDVLWMGNKATQRRSIILDRIRDELKGRGINIYMADGEEQPFIFGDLRTEYLNRAKITLNVARTWYDDNFSRFLLAAPNRSLIVSETLLPHCPHFQAGTHYLAADLDSLPSLISRCLDNQKQRDEIVDNCYRLAMATLTLRNSISTLMHAAEEKRTEALKTLPPSKG